MDHRDEIERPAWSGSFIITVNITKPAPPLHIFSSFRAFSSDVSRDSMSQKFLTVWIQKLKKVPLWKQPSHFVEDCYLNIIPPCITYIILIEFLPWGTHKDIRNIIPKFFMSTDVESLSKRTVNSCKRCSVITLAQYTRFGNNKICRAPFDIDHDSRSRDTIRAILRAGRLDNDHKN